MKKHDLWQPLAMAASALAGLAVGLLLPFAGQTMDAVLSRAVQPEAVAVFSAGGQASFAIEPVAPSGTPVSGPEPTPALEPALAPEQTPVPESTPAIPSMEAAAFSILPLGPAEQTAAVMPVKISFLRWITPASQQVRWKEHSISSTMASSGKQYSWSWGSALQSR